MKNLYKKKDMRQVIIGSGLKRKNEGKREQVEILDKIIHVLKEKRKKLQ